MYWMKKLEVYTPQPRRRTSAEAEAAIIALFDELTGEGVPRRKLKGLIRLALEARGVRTASGGRWADSTIQRVLERHDRWTRELSDQERFDQLLSWAQVDAAGCVLWPGATSDGRGKFEVDGKHILAYRFAYEREHGAILGGYDLHHTCRNPLCVNVGHLVPVTSNEHKTLEREEDVINTAALNGDLARELKELAKRDDPTPWPEPTRIGAIRVTRPSSEAQREPAGVGSPSTQ